MLELPMNSIAPVGGGLVLSAASNARISFSNGAALVVAALGAGVDWAVSGTGVNHATKRHVKNRMGNRMQDESRIPAPEASLASNDGDAVRQPQNAFHAKESLDTNFANYRELESSNS